MLMTPKTIILSLIAISAVILLAAAYNAGAANSAQIDFEKYSIRNLTRGPNIFSQSVNAEPGDALEFSLAVRNFSAVSGQSVTLLVYLPYGLQVDTSSLTINNVQIDNNIADGIFLGNIAGGERKEIRFVAKLNLTQQGTFNVHAQLHGFNIGTMTRAVLVTIFPSNSLFSTSYISPTPVPSYFSASVSLSKMGKNLTRGDAYWQKNIQAEPDHLLQFSLMLTAGGSGTARNIYLQDILDKNYLIFVPGSITIDGLPASDSLTSGELFLGDLAAGQTKLVKLLARVAPTHVFSSSSIILTNMAKIRGANFASSSNSTGISVAVNSSVISVPGPQSTPAPPSSTSSPQTVTKIVTQVVYLEKETVEVTKTGVNLTQNGTLLSREVSAHPGDELEFTVKITSLGRRPITGIVIKDTLPKELDYVYNSNRMGGQVIGDKIAREGFGLGTLNPGESEIITYRARVLPETEFKNGKTTLVNSVKVTSENALTAESSLTVLVKSGKLSLMGGAIVLGGFSFYLIILLLATIVFLLSFLLQEKRKNGHNHNLQNRSSSSL